MKKTAKPRWPKNTNDCWHEFEYGYSYLQISTFELYSDRMDDIKTVDDIVRYLKQWSKAAKARYNKKELSRNE